MSLRDRLIRWLGGVPKPESDAVLRGSEVQREQLVALKSELARTSKRCRDLEIAYDAIRSDWDAAERGMRGWSRAAMTYQKDVLWAATEFAKFDPKRPGPDAPADTGGGE